jgi:hypothetical protein
MGLNFRGVASYPSPSALNTRCGILYHEDFDRCARASALAGKFQLTRDTPTTENDIRVHSRVAKNFANLKPKFLSILAET